MYKRQIQVKRSILVVPTEHLERWQVLLFGILREVGKGDLPTFALVAIVGYKEKILCFPSSALCAVRGGSLLEGNRTQDAPQRHNRQLLRFELDEEHAPRLVYRKRSKPLDLFDCDRILAIDTEFLRRVVIKQILEVIRCDRPIQLILKVFDELRKGCLLYTSRCV